MPQAIAQRLCNQDIENAGQQRKKMRLLCRDYRRNIRGGARYTLGLEICCSSLIQKIPWGVLIWWDTVTLHKHNKNNYKKSNLFSYFLFI